MEFIATLIILFLITQLILINLGELMSRTNELNASVANLNEKADAIIAKLNASTSSSTSDADVDASISAINAVADKLGQA